MLSLKDPIALSLLLLEFLFQPNPDKPERIAKKSPRHKEELFIII